MIRMTSLALNTYCPVVPDITSQTDNMTSIVMYFLLDSMLLNFELFLFVCYPAITICVTAEDNYPNSSSVYTKTDCCQHKRLHFMGIK